MARPQTKIISVDYFFDRSIPEPNSGCWIWMGTTNEKGYGRVRTFGRNTMAHRACFEIANGITVAPKMEVCHRCDNPPCVNPDHLWVGTRRENALDASRKGRLAGRAWPYSKLWKG